MGFNFFFLLMRIICKEEKWLSISTIFKDEDYLISFQILPVILLSFFVSVFFVLLFGSFFFIPFDLLKMLWSFFCICLFVSLYIFVYCLYLLFRLRNISSLFIFFDINLLPLFYLIFRFIHLFHFLFHFIYPFSISSPVKHFIFKDTFFHSWKIRKQKQ